jgi:hypothetical protein
MPTAHRPHNANAPMRVQAGWRRHVATRQLLQASGTGCRPQSCIHVFPRCDCPSCQAATPLRCRYRATHSAAEQSCRVRTIASRAIAEGITFHAPCLTTLEPRQGPTFNHPVDCDRPRLDLTSSSTSSSLLLHTPSLAATPPPIPTPATGLHDHSRRWLASLTRRATRNAIPPTFDHPPFLRLVLCPLRPPSFLSSLLS